MFYDFKTDIFWQPSSVAKSTWSIKSFVHLKSWCSATKNHRHEHSFFKELHVSFFKYIMWWNDEDDDDDGCFHTVQNISCRTDRCLQSQTVWTGDDGDFFCANFSLAMRFSSPVHKERVHSQSDGEKVNNLVCFGGFWLHVYWKILRRSLYPSVLPVATEKRLHATLFLRTSKRAQFVFQSAASEDDQPGGESRAGSRPPPSPSLPPSPELGRLILGCRRTTDCRTASRWGTRASPGLEGDSGRWLPPDAPWAAPARRRGSSRGRWECESSPCGSSRTGRGRAGCRGRPRGWRRGRRPSSPERKQKQGHVTRLM